MTRSLLSLWMAAMRESPRGSAISIRGAVGAGSGMSLHRTWRTRATSRRDGDLVGFCRVIPRPGTCCSITFDPSQRAGRGHRRLGDAAGAGGGRCAGHADVGTALKHTAAAGAASRAPRLHPEAEGDGIRCISEGRRIRPAITCDHTGRSLAPPAMTDDFPRGPACLTRTIGTLRLPAIAGTQPADAAARDGRRSRCSSRPGRPPVPAPTRFARRAAAAHRAPFRLGISGVPGVGKSTFIETLGLHLIGPGHFGGAGGRSVVDGLGRLHPGRQDAHGAAVGAPARLHPPQPVLRHRSAASPRNDPRGDAGSPRPLATTS